MRTITATAVLLSLPLLTAGILHSHNHGAVHVHGAHRRALVEEVVTVTEVVYHTVTVAASASTSSAPPAPSSKESLPVTSPVSSSTVTSAALPATSPNAGGNPYQLLMPIASSALVLNSCNYTVYITSVGHSSCGPGKDCELVAPNSTYIEEMRKCETGGISLKVSKHKDMRRPIQFEYTVSDNREKVSYDISYLDCMENKNGEQDLSRCVGHEGGIQAAGGPSNDGSCPNYHCLAGQWCDTQAYVVAEFDYKPNAPVGTCAIDKGIAFELCAGDR